MRFELPIEVAEVPGWGWTGGAPGSPGFAVAQSYPGRLDRAHHPPARARVPARATVLACLDLAARAAGRRLRRRARGALPRARLARHASTVESVTKYLEHGWSGVRLYEPTGFSVGLAGDAPGRGRRSRTGARIHGEAVREGEDTTIDIVSTPPQDPDDLTYRPHRVALAWVCDTAAPSVSAPSAAPALCGDAPRAAAAHRSAARARRSRRGTAPADRAVRRACFLA